MADWALPVNASLYTSILTYIKDRDVDAGTLCYSAPTTPPTGMFKYLRSDNKFQEWNGASWDDKILAVAGGGTGSATASGARTNLGLGTMAVQNDSSVAITGGSITGVSLSASTITSGTLALARGGTGASLALGANGYVMQSNGGAVYFGNDGSALTSLNATNLTSGTVNVARLSGITTTQMASANVSQFTNDAGYVTLASAGVPIGTVIEYAGPKPFPAGITSYYLECDGSAVSRSTYSALFAIIGTTYGAGDGVNTFNLPDCRQRSAIGADGTFTLGNAGGSLSHSHGVGTLANDTASGHTHSVSGTSGAGSSHSHSMSGSTDSGGSHDHGGSTGSTAPPNHSHTFTTDATDVGTNSDTVNYGDGNYGSGSYLTGLSTPNHDHDGTTNGVIENMSHTHTISSGGSHTHGGGTLAAASESAHTHGAGSFAAASGGSHSHTISGSTATNAHAYIAFYKLIRFS